MIKITPNCGRCTVEFQNLLESRTDLTAIKLKYAKQFIIRPAALYRVSYNYCNKLKIFVEDNKLISEKEPFRHNDKLMKFRSYKKGKKRNR